MQIVHYIYWSSCLNSSLNRDKNQDCVYSTFLLAKHDMSESKSIPSLHLAILPIIVLVIMLGGSVALFGDSTTSGPGQIALIIAGVIAGVVGILNGHNWSDLEKGASESIQRAIPAIFILLMVGTLIGLWMFSGTIPYLIYWGLQIIVPQIFYVATVLLCAVVSISIGSSWTTAQRKTVAT